MDPVLLGVEFTFGMSEFTFGPCFFLGAGFVCLGWWEDTEMISLRRRLG